MRQSDLTRGPARWVRFTSGANAGRVVRAAVGGNDVTVVTFGRPEEFVTSYPTEPNDRTIINAAGYVTDGLRRYRVTPQRLEYTEAPASATPLARNDAGPDPLVPEPGVIGWVTATGTFAGRVPAGPIRSIARDGSDRVTLLWPNSQGTIGHPCAGDSMRRVVEGLGYDPAGVRYWMCSRHHTTEPVTDPTLISRVMEDHPMPRLTPFEDPAPSPEVVADQHERDIATIGRILMEQANRRSWCSEYDDIIGEINREISVPLPVRNQPYTVTYTVQETRTLVRTWNTHPTHADAQRFLPPGAVISAIHPGGDTEEDPF